MNVKHGFSTLNRLLGKKNKGHHLSKSTTNLNSSSQQNVDTINSSSSHHHHHHNSNHIQLEQNRITPLPIVTTNAPFEQTFRITVLLPKGQLYVARLGAKTKLEKLLEIVCENKQLDPEKYEFRHPVDSSQVFSCELTIGAVGLNEIRLCHKSEAYDNFNADDIIKLRHTGRDSLSSSEFSSRNSKHTLKTASPYSSTNSLNSIDSTGMSTNYRGQIVSLPPIPNSMRQFVPRQQNGHQPPVAPTRKKRAAPRPPSQNSIPEKEPVNGYGNSNGDGRGGNGGNKQEYNRQPLPRKEFHVSSPNLTHSAAEFTTLRSTEFHKSNASVDCNGNTCNRQNNNNNKNTISAIKDRTSSPVYSSPINTPNGSLTNGHDSFKRFDSYSSSGSSEFQKTAMKIRPVSMSAISDENRHNGITENGFSGNECEDGSERRESSSTINGSTETIKSMPEPVPRKKIIIAKKKAPAPPPRTISTPIALPRNTTSPQQEHETTKNEENVTEHQKIKMNGSLPQEYNNKRESVNGYSEKAIQNHIQTSKVEVKQEKLHTNSKISNGKLSASTLQAENQISPPDSPQSSSFDSSQTCTRSAFESSSDEEEQIKVYNLKLGKTIVKPLTEHKTYEDLTVISSLSNESTTSLSRNDDTNTSEVDSSKSLESPTWAITIPAPPNFADESSIVSDDNKNQGKMELTKTDSTCSTITNSSNTSDSSIPPKTAVEKNNLKEKLINSEIVKTKIETSETIITSDIEDGYRGGGKDKNECQKVNCNGEVIQKKAEEKIEYEHIKEKDKKLETSDPTAVPNEGENIDNNRKDIITELNHVITENKLDTMITRTENDVEEIESPRPSVLTNFKIQSYNNNNTEMIRTVEEMQNGNSVPEILEKPKLNGEKEVFLPEEKFASQEKENISSSKQKHDKLSQKEDKNSEFIQIERNDIVPKYEKILVDKNQDIFHSNRGEEEKILIQFTNAKDKPLKYATKELTSQSKEEDRGLYKKRSSLTSNNGVGGVSPQLFKSKVNITRSDSFHSTQHPNSIDSDTNGLSMRSLSYVSLLNAQNLEQNKTNLNQNFADTNRRKSSSELSIGESPSLQSLIVMKSILNSRKNSLNTEKDLQNDFAFNSRPYPMNSHAENFIQQNKKSPVTTTAYDCDSSKENSPKNKIVSQEERTAVVHKKNESEPEKKWKYQGPPSINLTSWSDRPKIQVSIKNDGDYKFGVGGGGIGGTSTSVTTFPRVYRNSTTNLGQSQPQNGVTTTQINSVRIIGEQPKVPFVRSVEYKKPTPMDSSTVETNSTVYIKPVNSVNTATATATSTATTTTSKTTSMTLGRMPKTINRTASFAPTVKGFKNSGIVPLKANENDFHSLKTESTHEMNGNLDKQNTTSQPKVNLQTWKNSSLGRSNSVITTYSSKFSAQNGHNDINGITSSSNIKDTEENPFSKIVLRKTGLKERMMTQQPTETETIMSKPSIVKIDKQNNCAKLQMKLTTTIEQQNPKKTSTTFVPTPPPPPVIRSVVTKQNSHCKQNGNGIIGGGIGNNSNGLSGGGCIQEPRDQLLSAIRNFNRDALKRS